ncbi:hypothetical protein TNCV_1080091 [Trichonephila clavipes]|nr:hypothetical protein TNCV_1080091 [Trichonephila clavipes]
MQQQSLNSSLEATVGSPLVHLVGMLLNGSTSSLPNSPLQPSVTSITYGPWYTTFATSLILDGPIFPCTMNGRLDQIMQCSVMYNYQNNTSSEGDGAIWLSLAPVLWMNSWWGRNKPPILCPLPPTSREDLWLDGYLEYPLAAKVLYIYQHPCLEDLNPMAQQLACH